jgi:hypothetical protein
MTTIRSTATESAISEPITVPPFAVISGAQVQHALQGREKQIVELVEATYRLHGAGDSVNPPSYFLRFPDRPSSRIIALLATTRRLSTSQKNATQADQRDRVGRPKQRRREYAERQHRFECRAPARLQTGA